MKIIVLFKQVPDTYEERTLDLATGLLERDASDPIIDESVERAMEAALRYKDGDKSTRVELLAMGPATVTAALRKGLSLGADTAVHILDGSLVGADLGVTAAVLSAQLARSEFDLIIAGNESTDGRGGVIPAMVAEHLKLPHLTHLDESTISPSVITGVRATESGSLSVRAALPAVISVTERSPEVRFPNFRGILSAKKKPLTVVTLQDLGLAPSSVPTGSSTVVSTTKRPARTGGTKVVDEGNAGVELAEFLAAAHLI